jgi:Helix-turn-helix domain
MSERQTPVWTWRSAIREADVPSLTKLVCLVIADYLNDASDRCWPSVKRLMHETGLSNRSMSTHLQNAVEAGLLAMERRVGKNGRFEGTVYRPRIPAETVPPREPPSRDTNRVKLLHSDWPREAASPGPRELGDVHRVKEVHGNYPKGTTQERTSPFPPSSKTEFPNPHSNVTFDGIKLTLLNGTRQRWLTEFDGDEKRLDLALTQAAGYIQSSSFKPLEAQVNAQLARIAGDKRDRARNYQTTCAANKSKSSAEASKQRY